MAAYSNAIQSAEAGETAIFRELGPERYKTDRQPQKRAEGLIVCTNRIISGYAVRTKSPGGGKSTAEGAGVLKTAWWLVRGRSHALDAITMSSLP